MNRPLPQLSDIPRQKVCGHCAYAAITDVTGCPWRGPTQRTCPGRTDKPVQVDPEVLAWGAAAAASAMATAAYVVMM